MVDRFCPRRTFARHSQPFCNMKKSPLHEVALTFVPMVGAVTARALVSYCGGAEAVFRTSKRDLLRIPGIGPVVTNNLSSAEALQKAERELAWMEKHGVEAVFFTDERYPYRLREIPDAPLLLYARCSDFQILNAERVVAIVGTRQPSEHGKAICEEIVEGLLPYNALIISGLAYGIDVTAHKKANLVGLPNFGVLGNGLARLYPAAHQSVAQKMLENGGLLSEYPHETPPDREHFPMRNRIIAGLSDCLIVVETAATGGSMISADLAMQYDREVFAVPGRPRDAKSIGCNHLIKSEKARLLETADDLADLMRWDTPSNPRATQTQLLLDLSPAETRIVEAVRARPEIPIDDLALAAQMPSGELAALLLGLEFRGALRTLPGKRYILV